MALASQTTQEDWVPDPSRDLGQRLALVRQHYGWNVTEAARECGLDPASWTAWETEGRMPRNLVDVCEKIANRSRCQFYWLLTGKEMPMQRTGSQPGTASDNLGVTGEYHPAGVVVPFPGNFRVIEEQEHLAPVHELRPAS